MKRREFLKNCFAASLGLPAGCVSFGEGPMAWRRGEFQIHFIYTGLGEQMFWIFPDGTTMLLDCGAIDYNPAEPAPVRPGAEHAPGQWVARYLKRVNPAIDPSRVDYLMLSHYHPDHADALPDVAKSIKFTKVFDRAYPDLDFPFRLSDYDRGGTGKLVSRLYRVLAARDGTVVEKFQVGARDQVRMLHGGASGFSVFNLCANGFIADERTGRIVDCYENHPAKKPGYTGRHQVNENGMCIGMIVRYGDFSFFTAGDFSDNIRAPGGKGRLEIEEILAGHVGRVDVAKVNHHGYKAIPAKLAAALRPKAWINCAFNRYHNTVDTMTNLTDRKIYPGDRRVYPTFILPETYCADVPQAALKGGDVVLTVAPGGKSFSVDYRDVLEC